MGRWFQRFRFLWQEEVSPPGDAPGGDGQEPTGVPRPLRMAPRFALIAAVAASLRAQIIGVRLVAPVDAQPS
jgi:hypothetical protein